jgi:hypothetical protein
MPDPGKTVTFSCGMRISACCQASVTRRCTLGQPDIYTCTSCGTEHLTAHPETPSRRGT